jgi:hypothetical protein
MIPGPLPGQGDDDREPDGSGSQRAGNGPEDPDAACADALAAATEANECEMPPEEAEHGLFVCLPAEQLDVAGFVQDGQSDTMAPGPLLAAVVHTLTGDDGAGLASLSDDQLMGIIAATQRLERRERRTGRGRRERRTGRERRRRCGWWPGWGRRHRYRPPRLAGSWP